MIKDSGERTEFTSGAVRDMHEGKGRFDLLPMCVLMRLAKHYENGCKKYGDRNWEKGIPCHSFADSAMRHLVKYMDGWNDEDHLIAAIWNLCGLAWTEEKHPDLMDIPARLKEGDYMSGSVSLVDGHIDEPRKTNFDRIRNMSVDELTDFLFELGNHNTTICNILCGRYKSNCGRNCVAKLKQWLESEADTE